MPRIGRFSNAPTKSARFVTGMVLAALIILEGSALAQQAADPGQRRNRAAARGTAGRSRSPARTPAVPPPTDPAAQRARQLMRSIDWQMAPEIAGLGVYAEFRIPRNFVFTGPKGGNALLEATRYPAPKNLLGILAPYGSFEWFIVFEWKEGIQKDDAKGKPDADALLKELRAENEAENATRRTRGWAQRTDLDWEHPPAYDGRGEHLTWTTRSNFAGRRAIRSTTRTFGKRGAIDSHVVASEQNQTRVGNTLTNFLTLVEFTDGPNGGMRREDLAGTGGSSSSSSGTVTYTPTTAYRSSASGAATRSLVRSPRTIGGFITAACGGLGAAFRRKKRAA